MIAYTVQPGDTLSAIAAAHGESLSQLEAQNPQVTDPNLIYVGNTINIGGGSEAPAYQPAPSYHASPSAVYTPPVTHSYSSGSGELGDIPGMPSSLAHCIAYRESTNDTNPAADGNAYGIIPASGYNVAGDSLAQQNQVAGEIYASVGGQAWAADGCPGT